MTTSSLKYKVYHTIHTIPQLAPSPQVHLTVSAPLCFQRAASSAMRTGTQNSSRTASAALSSVFRAS